MRKLDRFYDHAGTVDFIIADQYYVIIIANAYSYYDLHYFANCVLKALSYRDAIVCVIVCYLV